MGELRKWEGGKETKIQVYTECQAGKRKTGIMKSKLTSSIHIHILLCHPSIHPSVRPSFYAIPNGGTIPCSSFRSGPTWYDTLNRILIALPLPVSTPSMSISCCTPFACCGAISRPDCGRSCNV